MARRCNAALTCLALPRINDRPHFFCLAMSRLRIYFVAVRGNKKVDPHAEHAPSRRVTTPRSAAGSVDCTEKAPNTESAGRTSSRKRSRTKRGLPRLSRSTRAVAPTLRLDDRPDFVMHKSAICGKTVCALGVALQKKKE